MLVLSSKESQSFMIGDQIEVKIVAIQGGRVQLGFSAPQDVRIRRAELGSTIEARATIGNPTVVIDPPVAPA